MASGAIKGITIKLGADASELTSALYKTESALKNTQSQLRQVNQALKFNPGNVELLSQKFTLLQREIVENDKYVEDLKKALQEMKNAGVDETADEFMTLQRAIIQAESKGESFRQELHQTKTALDGAKNGTENLQKGLNSIDTSKAKGEISTLQIAMGNLIANGISRLVNAISNNLGSALERSDTLANFPKVMEGMGVSAKDASDAIDGLAEGLEGLPTTLDDGASAVKRFTAVNGDVDKSTEYFLALNNAILAGGESADTQQTAIEQLSQAYAKGKPDMQEWRALQQAMPAQLEQIAKSMDMTSAELGEGLRNGTISMDELLDRIVELNQNGGKGFKSFADQAKDATGGIETTITGLNTAITRGLQQAIDNFGRDNFTAIVGTISSAIEGLLGGLGTLFGFIGKHSTAFSILAAGIGAVVGAIATWNAITKIAAAVQTALNIVLSANPIGLIILAIVGLAAAFVVAYKKSETFRNVVRRIGAFFKDGFIGAINLVKGAIDKAQAAVSAITNAFSRMIAKIKSVASSIKGTLKNAFSGLASIGTNIVKGIWNGISNGLGWIKGKIKGWVGNVKNFLKKLFGIKSPSRWARDTIGYNIAAGMAEGISGSAGLVDSAINGIRPNMSITGRASATMGAPLGLSLARALSGVERTTILEIDGRAFAQTTAPYMRTSIGNINEMNSRRMGVR